MFLSDAVAYAAYEARCDDGQEADEHAEDAAEEQRWIACLLATAPATGAENGETQMFADQEGELPGTRLNGAVTGVYAIAEIGGVEIADDEEPSVEQIDALPSTVSAEEEQERRDEAVDALSLLSPASLQMVLGAAMACLPEDRRVSIICSCECGLSDAGLATVVAQGREVLMNGYEQEAIVVGAAQLAVKDAVERKREKESALCAALGPLAVYAFKKVG